MQPDDELCLCFHVTQRKVVNYLRIERPRSVSQLADCYGAGTGCGWCRPFLKKLFDAQAPPASAGGALTPLNPDPNHNHNPAPAPAPANPAPIDLPTAQDYAHQRSAYVRSGKGTPPAGATPIDEQP
jgi:bacterioferritin-associated ferredoxin